MKGKHPQSRFALLDPLLGIWAFEITNDGPPIVTGRAVIDHAESGRFVRIQAFADPWLPATPELWKENSPYPYVAIIGADDPSGTFSYNYSDARGVRRVQQMTYVKGVWRTWGQAGPGFYQRFEGILSQDGEMIDGTVGRSTDNKQWEQDFKIRYRRVSDGDRG